MCVIIQVSEQNAFLKVQGKLVKLFCHVILASIFKCFKETFSPLQTECPGVPDRDTCHAVGYPGNLPTSETLLHTEISSHANKLRFLIHGTITGNTDTGNHLLVIVLQELPQYNCKTKELKDQDAELLF